MIQPRKPQTALREPESENSRDGAPRVAAVSSAAGSRSTCSACRACRRVRIASSGAFAGGGPPRSVRRSRPRGPGRRVPRRREPDLRHARPPCLPRCLLRARRAITSRLRADSRRGRRRSARGRRLPCAIRNDGHAVGGASTASARARRAWAPAPCRNPTSGTPSGPAVALLIQAARPAPLRRACSPSSAAMAARAPRVMRLTLAWLARLLPWAGRRAGERGSRQSEAAR